MPEYSFALGPARSLVERIDTAPRGASLRRWVLRDDNQRHYHGRIPVSEDPVYLELRWKAQLRGREQAVGTYALHLAELRRAGYVRLEGEGTAANEIRLRFYRGDRGVIYIKVRQDQPALPIGTVDTSLD